MVLKVSGMAEMIAVEETMLPMAIARLLQKKGKPAKGRE